MVGFLETKVRVGLIVKQVNLVVDPVLKIKEKDIQHVDQQNLCVQRRVFVIKDLIKGCLGNED